jgi:hypothetical protein
LTVRQQARHIDEAGQLDMPTGGGFFYLPPGARDSQDWVGSALFT